ncbi:hypothetical protein [Streptoalloteichus tenebrarius]|nr:hypothetical protein [Streptoalloteichus tenebrarius]
MGSASVDTVLALARRHADRPEPALAVPTDPERPRRFSEFTDFAHLTS